MSESEGATVRLSPRCPMCQGEMEEGFVLDRTYGANFPAVWIAGKPQRSWLTGLNIGQARRYVLASSRCVECGYVALYANERSVE